MKVLHIFPNFDIGGPQRRFAQIVNATDDEFVHTIVSINRNFDALNLLRDRRHILTLDKPWREGNLLVRASRCARTLREVRPDLLVTYNWGAIEWALVNLQIGIPHIHIEDGFGPEEVNRQISRRVWGRQLALSRSFAIVVPSLSLKSIAENKWRFPAGRIRLITNGITIDPDPSAPRLERSDLGLNAQSLVIGWIGGLRKEKKLDRLVRAFASLSLDGVLVLVGDGPERTAIEAEIEAQGIANRVRFLGSRTDVQRILPLFDVLALSSDTEQMPMVILEAMAAGLPVASTDVGDIANMLSPENKPFLVERSDEALASALERLLQSASLRTSIGTANRRYVQLNYPADRMIKTYIDLFRCAATAGARKTKDAA